MNMVTEYYMTSTLSVEHLQLPQNYRTKRWVAPLITLLLSILVTRVNAQVYLSNVAIVEDSGGYVFVDVTDNLNAGDSVSWVQGRIENQNYYGIDVSCSFKLDGNTIVSESSHYVPARAISTVSAVVNPAVVMTAGPHVLRFVDTSDVGPTRNFTVATGGTSPEMDVQGNAVSILDGNSSPSLADHTDFGSALVAGGEVVRTYTIRNTGDGALALSGTPKVVVDGPQAAAFTVTAQPTSPVAASGTTTFEVTFDPGSTGTCSATLSIANDDANENPYNFSIQGMGTTPPDMQTPEIELDGSVVFCWTSYSNHLYTVHHSSNLMNGFSVLQSNILATSPMNTYTATANGASMTFWKISTEE